jgi:hypothetical protein
MNWKDSALILAGLIGGGTAILHGVLVQRLMVRPIAEALAPRGSVSNPIRRLIPVLLHFSTIAWLAGGITLVVAAAWLDEDAKRSIGLFVGALYLFGAIANAWGTRARHPGWLLMAAAVALIGVGVCG